MTESPRATPDQGSAELSDVLRQALSALHTAAAGLEWYRDRCVGAVDGSDDEADEEIGTAIAGLESLLAIATQGAPTPAQADKGKAFREFTGTTIYAGLKVSHADAMACFDSGWMAAKAAYRAAAGDAGKTGESVASSAMGDDGDGTPEQEAFCTGNCCWSGHHPDCFRASPSLSNERADKR